MATLKEADKAREIWSEYLRDLGAFAVGVTDFTGHGEYGLEAYFSTSPAIKLPRTLGVRINTDFLQVPLQLSIGDMFEPQ